METIPTDIRGRQTFYIVSPTNEEQILEDLLRIEAINRPLDQRFAAEHDLFTGRLTDLPRSTALSRLFEKHATSVDALIEIGCKLDDMHAYLQRLMPVHFLNMEVHGNYQSRRANLTDWNRMMMLRTTYLNTAEVA